MLTRDVIDSLNELADLKLMDDWDNSGLQIGRCDKAVAKVLLALDLTEEVSEKAVSENFDMIVTHHPFFFSTQKSIVLEGYRGRIISEIIKNDITVFSAHTNLDLSSNGVNDVLCEKLGISGADSLTVSREDKLCKIAVYTPIDYSDMLRESVGTAGFGRIGNYTHCSFSAKGEGRFNPVEGAEPFIGRTGQIEVVEEEKIEFLVYECEVAAALELIKKVHPYEEVAYDVYPVENTGRIYGYGRIGEIESPVNLCEFAKRVKESLGCPDVRVYGDMEAEIKRVALCGGSGSSFIKDAKKRGADVYITGDIKHHDAQVAMELGIRLIDATHFHMEKHVLEHLRNYLSANLRCAEIEVVEHNVAEFETI